MARAQTGFTIRPIGEPTMGTPLWLFPEDALRGLPFGSLSEMTHSASLQKSFCPSPWTAPT